MEPNGRVRKGSFNWINLLVLVGVLAILVGLLIPATTGPSDGRGRQPHCQNNLRQVATALLNYENSHGMYPGYANVLITNAGKPYVDPNTGKVSPVSFVVPILPLLDRPDIYRGWKTPANRQHDGDKNALHDVSPKVSLQLLQCPSDPPTNSQSPSNSYVVNCSMKDWDGSATMPRDWKENGVFFDRFTGDPRVTGGKGNAIKMVEMSNAFITRHDGLQSTILMSENVDAGIWTDTDEARIGVLWNPKGTIDATKDPPHLAPRDENMRINRGTGMSDLPGSNVDRAVFARPSSYHPGGVNVVFCDGHLKFVSENIDYYVYCLLMSTDGDHVREPGSDEVAPGFAKPINDSWIY
jgi:prepilin-type processing-associated H-X9-DG protein